MDQSNLLIVPFLFTSVVSFQFNDFDGSGTNDLLFETKASSAARWSNDAFEGEICNVNKFPVAGDNPEFFYMCMTPTINEKLWPWQTIGVWTKMQCKDGKWFSPESRMCRQVNSVRRMQESYCRSYPTQCAPVQSAVPAPIMTPQPSCIQPPCAPVCQPEQPQCPKPVVPRPCPQASSSSGCNNNNNCGGLCSWMLDPLKPSGNGYMQCVPKLTGEKMQYCGQWIKRPCPSRTRFNAQLQVCVHDPRGSGCPAQQIPIGQCNIRKQCPGQTSCHLQSNVCCQ